MEPNRVQRGCVVAAVPAWSPIIESDSVIARRGGPSTESNRQKPELNGWGWRGMRQAELHRARVPLVAHPRIVSRGRVTRDGRAVFPARWQASVSRFAETLGDEPRMKPVTRQSHSTVVAIPMRMTDLNRSLLSNRPNMIRHRFELIRTWACQSCRTVKSLAGQNPGHRDQVGIAIGVTETR